MPKGERGTSKPYLTDKSPFWQIKYYVPGEDKPRYESSKSTDKNDAIRLLNKRRSEIDTRHVSAANVTVNDLLKLHLDDLRRNRRSDRSVKGFIKIHLAPAFGKVLASNVTSKMITNFIAQKQAAGRADASINRYLSALRRSFKLGQEELPPLVTTVPKIKLLEENNTREGFLEHDQYLSMREELPLHQRLILVLLYHWGMRIGEVLALRWDQVDWDAGLVRLSKKQTKGKHARNAPIYGELRAWLEMAYADPEHGKTIISWKGHAISEVKTSWNKARVRAGLPELLRHDLRRTAIRNMTRAGIPENRAMLISGHKDPNVFRRYDITAEGDLRSDGEKIALYLEKKAKVVGKVVGVNSDSSVEVVN